MRTQLQTNPECVCDAMLPLPCPIDRPQDHWILTCSFLWFSVGIYIFFGRLFNTIRRCVRTYRVSALISKICYALFAIWSTCRRDELWILIFVSSPRMRNECGLWWMHTISSLCAPCCICTYRTWLRLLYGFKHILWFGFSCDFYRARKIHTELVYHSLWIFIKWRVFFAASVPSSAHDGRENDKESVRESCYRITFAFHHILHFSTRSRFGTFISVRCGNLTSLHRFWEPSRIIDACIQSLERL